MHINLKYIYINTMESIYCISILRISKKPTFISKYLINTNYSTNTITDILDGEDLNIETGSAHAFEYDNLKYLLCLISSDELICIVSTKLYKSYLLSQLVVDIKTYYEIGKKYSEKTIYDHLKMLGDKYNNINMVDPIVRAQNKIDNVKSIMQQNIELALVSCEKLESIEKQTQELQASAGFFKKKTGDLKRKMWWRNIKTKLLIGGVILVIIGIFVGALCAIYSPHK